MFEQAWRVHVVWDKNVIVAIPFIILTIASSSMFFYVSPHIFVPLSRGMCGTTVLGVATVVNIRTVGNPSDPGLVRLSTATWALYLAVQGGGPCIIAWRKLATPVVVANNKGAEHSPCGILWLIVESGCMYGITTLFTLAFSFHQPALANVLISALGQIAVLVPLSITLRELWKKEHAYRMDKVNMHTFLVEDRRSPRPHSPIEDGGQSKGMFVQVKTLTAKYTDFPKVKIAEEITSGEEQP
ncbi:hypothetical protein K488DRAFT_86478 [Vararia minispora EC-137]|uniref:Uncharacterized protein n=1 Tax=Vararia minispora EC-137 TaxID=1314806 RepID=A0ACB8QJ91_9AGAM|nr:hypothetical protein K488DRAFT_86478 [Vararia minispora EC-137]